jgi:hypothetical protein
VLEGRHLVVIRNSTTAVVDCVIGGRLNQIKCQKFRLRTIYQNPHPPFPESSLGFGGQGLFTIIS